MIIIFFSDSQSRVAVVDAAAAPMRKLRLLPVGAVLFFSPMSGREIDTNAHEIRIDRRSGIFQRSTACTVRLAASGISN